MYPRRALRRDRRFVLPFGLEDFPRFVNHAEFPAMRCYRFNGGLVSLLGHARSRTRASPPRVAPPPRRSRATETVSRLNSMGNSSASAFTMRERGVRERVRVGGVRGRVTVTAGLTDRGHETDVASASLKGNRNFKFSFCNYMSTFLVWTIQNTRARTRAAGDPPTARPTRNPVGHP